MSLTLEKLQQLKRQAGGALQPARHAPAAPTASSIDGLRSLLRLRVPSPLRPRAHDDRTLPGIELRPGLHYREKRLPDDAVPPEFDGAFDRRDTLPASRLLFFDTETTGLAGGTGTRAFMIGAADWHMGELRIRQLTISTMSAESAMLEEFRGWLAPDTVLVSYNGKCYDAPLLTTRYRLARMANPLAGHDHVDLLYPTRRSYRGVYENCRLATIERQVLKIVREDDLPGAEAPAAWLSYLRGGSAHTLRRVLAHNHQDVVSLSRLLRHLAEVPEPTASVELGVGPAAVVAPTKIAQLPPMKDLSLTAISDGATAEAARRRHRLLPCPKAVSEVRPHPDGGNASPSPHVVAEAPKADQQGSCSGSPQREGNGRGGHERDQRHDAGPHEYPSPAHTHLPIRT